MSNTKEYIALDTDKFLATSVALDTNKFLATSIALDTDKFLTTSIALTWIIQQFK